MIDHWFIPINVKKILKEHTLYKYQFGQKIELFEQVFPDLTPIKVALIGLDESSNLVRKHLYQMSFNFGRLKIADFGILKQQDNSHISLVLKEILLKGIVPIILATPKEIAAAQFDAYQTFNQLINLVFVNERIPLTLDGRKRKQFHLDKILKHPNKYLFNLGVIGYQSHYVDGKILDFFDKHFFEYIRLGSAKNKLEETEPILRDADCVTINISALKKSEAPANSTTSPSGFFAEEACQLTYYAGMNDKLTSISFVGFEPEYDRDEQTAQVLAQMIWYFLSGFAQRNQDYPIKERSFTEYIVNFKNSDYQITFWKSNRSDRWWMQVPTSNQKQERHKLVPCSYNDYLLACREELPERLINAYNRFSS